MKQAHEPKKIRILIGDREEVFRLGARKLFALEDDLRVVAQAASREEAVALAERFRPHLLMVQGEIAGEPLANFLEEIQRVSRRSKVVIIASTHQGEMASSYLEAGAAGVVMRTAPLSHFVRCAREAMQGKRRPVKAAGAAPVESAAPGPKPPLRPARALTRREKAVIGCLMQGFPNREIARSLSMAEQTVKNHLRSVFDKLGVSDRLELVLYAIHQKLDIPLIEAGQEQAPGADS